MTYHLNKRPGPLSHFKSNGVAHILVKGPNGLLVITPSTLRGPAEVIPMSTATGEPFGPVPRPVLVPHPFFGAISKDGSTWYRVAPADRAKQDHPQRGVPLKYHEVGELVYFGSTLYEIMYQQGDGRWVVQKRARNI